jgi:formylglycine-generating enzyme required for sulfatase activity
VTRGTPRGPGLAVLAACALALTAFGVYTERANLFPPLRFALQRTALELPSTVSVDRRVVAAGLPLLSVYLEPADLDFLLGNKLRHGRDFERRGSVTYFDEGRLLFTGAAGVRVHGGGSRLTSPRQGFRLFFRRRYGFNKLGTGVLFGPASQPLQRLVVHNDVRRDTDGTEWRLVNPLGYDIARRVGCVTPETQPARFVLNGEDYGLYVLTEHFDDEFFASHRPGRQISMKLADMEALRARLDALRPLTSDKVASVIDTENLVSWFISTAFLATRDAYQGPGQFLDEADGRWFWVTWDVDLSLRDWDHESFQYLLNVPGERERGRRPSEPRPFVLGTLIAEDAAFRDRLAARVDAMLNHQLTQAFLDERRSHYEEVADRFGVTEVEYQRRTREFLARRRAFFRDVVEQWLNTAGSVRVTARREGGGRLLVDGFEKEGPYEGWYFPGREVSLRAPDGVPVRWIVNGSPVEVSTELPLRADGPLDIVAVPPAEIRSGRISDSATIAGAVAESEIRPDPEPLRWQPIPAPPGGRAFEMTATEVTVGQYRRFARASGATLPRQPHWSGDDHPVVNLTWAEAGAFCEGADGRLPTEAEWEFAARGGTRSLYWWGDAWDPLRANVLGRPPRDPWPYTAPVGSYSPNAFGLHDVVGNVWEWTSTPYSSNPSTGRLSLKTVRGGAWANRPENVTLPNRQGLSATGRHNLYVGIRCAR